MAENIINIHLMIPYSMLFVRCLFTRSNIKAMNNYKQRRVSIDIFLVIKIIGIAFTYIGKYVTVKSID